MDKPYAIDRIDNKSNIRGHLTLDGERTICGLGLAMNQPAAGNGSCKRCDRIARDRAARVAALFLPGTAIELTAEHTAHFGNIADWLPVGHRGEVVRSPAAASSACPPGGYVVRFVGLAYETWVRAASLQAVTP